MPFEGAVAVRYHDQVALPEERLRDSELEIIARVKDKTGGVKELPRIKVPRVLSDQLNIFQDVDRLQHYGQLTGSSASQDTTYNSQGSQFDINPAAFFDDEDTERNTQFLLGVYAKEK